MVSLNSATLLRLNRLIRSNRAKFFGVLAADLLGMRHTIVRLDPVMACNLRCGMCYFSDPDWYARSTGPRFTPEQAERIAAMLFPEALQVHIGCGAEPTMWKNYPDLVRLAKHHGVPFVGLVTNGQLLTRESITRLIDNGLDEITISIHGVDAPMYERLMKGAKWETLIRTLELLSEVKTAKGKGRPHLRLNFTANNDNVGQMGDILSVFGRYGPATLQIRPITDLGATAYTDKELARSLDAYNSAIRHLQRECAERGVTLMANLADPTYRQNNARAVVYEHAVIRYASPARVWQNDFAWESESYQSYKRRTGYRGRLLRWAIFGSKELETKTSLATSDVY